MDIHRHYPKACFDLECGLAASLCSLLFGSQNFAIFASTAAVTVSGIVSTMETLLRQSRSMCPFLNKTSPATLRSLSTSTTPRHVSPGGGSMSNLQVLARRCPVMGKAMAVQSAKTGQCSLNGVFGGTRAYGGKARMHTTGQHHATVAPNVMRREQNGKDLLINMVICFN